MSGDDLGAWLKAAAENKITTKNTWRSTLIDHFKNIEEFRERHGINFLKASCALDGCAKVYSTRVDDVSENAMRLLEGFGGEDSGKKKQGKRQGRSTVERNVANLNIKVTMARRPLDPKFLYLSSLAEGVLMVDVVGISSDGVFRMSSCGDLGGGIVEDLKVPVGAAPGLLISPSISEDREVQGIVMEPVADEGMSSESEAVDGDRFEFENDPVSGDLQRPVFKETSFSYFKGWAGPGHWKIQGKRGKAGGQKAKEALFVDFTEAVDHGGIMEAGSTLFDPSVIVERRKSGHMLPQDFRLETGDLYKYMVRDGFFNLRPEALVAEMSMSYDAEPCVVPEPEDEFIADVCVQGAARDEPVQAVRRAPKRINIKRLKDNVFESVQRAKRTTLVSLFESVPKMYEGRESEDISIHLCFISLLHLANEKNIRLEDIGNDVRVQMPS